MKIKTTLSLASLLGTMLLSPVATLQAGADGFISPDEITMDVIPAGKPSVILNRDESRVSFVSRTNRPDDSPLDDRDRERPEVVIPEVEPPEIEIVREKEPPVCPRRS